ncbi:unnamed protein product, partial [Sphagnum jensenii]
MGCTNSKIDRDDAVARCKARKRFMRQAVDSRHAFAASHAHYVIALKSVGSALRQFAEGEVKDPAAAVIPSDGPSTALVALAPSPLPKPPPPPPMSPSLLSPSLPPSPPPLPPPLSPPHIELNGPRNTTLFKSPELVREADNEEPSSPPPPPLITPIGYDDDWNSSVQAPPSRQGQYLPRPPISYSSWHDLFMDPFRPGPHSDQGYMLSNQNSEHSQPAETYDNKLPQVEEEDDIPDLEDVDTDGPASKDSDYDEKEKNATAITKVEPDPRSPKETVEKNLFKGAVKVNRELAIIIPEQGGRDLLDVIKEVDDLFLKAADSAETVSNILETRKVHYHSSFSENLREVGESARISFWKLSAKPGSPVHHRAPSNASIMSEETASIGSSMRSLSSFRSTAWVEGCGMTGSHASTLDRLYAWEKKLYLEVKGAEDLRKELEKKYALYRNQDTNGEDQVVIDKMRANIKMLQTQMLVSIQAVDGAAIEIQKLRDDDLYPQLLDLLEGMMVMWKDMSVSHQAQMKAVETLKRLGNSAASEPTTTFHRHSTVQLEAALNKWSMMLQKVLSTQRDYMRNMTGWLRISLLQFPEDMDTTGSCSPSHSSVSPLNSSPIYALCQQWQASMDQLPDHVVLKAIAGFAAVVREMLRLQWEELKIKKRVESFARELVKRETSLFSASMREPPSLPLPPHPPRSPASSSSESDENNLSMIVREGATERPDVLERRLRMEASKRKLEEEQEAERKAHSDTRAYTLNSLQTGLPYMFQALVTFSNVQADTYDKLY